MMTIRKLNKKQKMVLIALAVVFILSLIYEKPAVEIERLDEEVTDLEQYLIEEEDFDFSTPEVYIAAKEIEARTSNQEEAVRETLRFVVNNVRYSSAITINYCFNEKASTVLNSGIGDCVSMSRLAVSLLRAQGIPARSVGGCLSQYRRCVPVFAVIPRLEAQVTEMVPDDFKKRGFLHEWVEIYYNGKWNLAESTSAQVFDIPSCYNMEAYLIYAYDTNPKDRCVVLSSDFWKTCREY